LSSCVIWDGNVSAGGYGRVSCGTFTGNLYAHRLAYERRYGPIPDGAHVHHTCGVRLCVNPDHLAVLEAGEHIRHHHGQRTHCCNGHPFSPENTYLNPRRRAPYRVCRICNREAVRRYQERIA
jgi:hypothetical protein